jgi:hypothetical protein
MGANAQTSVPAFTAGQVLTAAQVTQINTGIPVFASSTERDAAFGGAGEKTLAEGQMAYLEDTNATQYYDGSSWTELGGTAGVLQVLSTSKTDTFTTTSTSFVDVTGVSQAITPSSATNKVLVTVTGVGNVNSAVDIFRLNLVRDSTNIGQSTGGAVYNETAFIFTASSSHGTPFAMSFLDSPATTSATTYKLQLAVTSGTGAIGRTAANANTGAITTITVMEVSA